MPKDELFPNSEGVYRKDVEANLEDEKISSVTMNKDFQVFSHSEMQEQQSGGYQPPQAKEKKTAKFVAEAAAELTPADQDFKSNMEHVHAMMVDSHGIKRP